MFPIIQLNNPINIFDYENDLKATWQKFVQINFKIQDKAIKAVLQ